MYKAKFFFAFLSLSVLVYFIQRHSDSSKNNSILVASQPTVEIQSSPVAEMTNIKASATVTPDSSIAVTPSPNTQKKWIVPDPQKVESFLLAQHTDEELIQFLKEQKVDSFTSIAENSRPAAIPDIHLNGCYQGEVTLTNGEKWKLSVFHQFDEPGKSDHGSYSILLRELNVKGLNGRAGEGHTRAIRSAQDLPGQVILEVSPQDDLQLFYWAVNDSWIGNYYRKKQSLYDYLGTAKLLKSDHCEWYLRNQSQNKSN